MRTNIDLPETLLKHLEARAALEGRTLRDLVLERVEKGPSARERVDPGRRFAARPLVGSGAPSDVPLPRKSNADLYELRHEDADEDVRALRFMAGR